jgi:hypothetical protein
VKTTLQNPDPYVYGISVSQSTKLISGQASRSSIIETSFIDENGKKSKQIDADSTSIRLLQYSFPILNVKNKKILNYKVQIYLNNLIIHEENIKGSSSGVDRKIDLARYISSDAAKGDGKFEVVVFPLNSNLNAFGSYFTGSSIFLNNPNLNPDIFSTGNAGASCTHIFEETQIFIEFTNNMGEDVRIKAIRLATDQYRVESIDSNELESGILVGESTSKVFTLTFAPTLMLNQGDPTGVTDTLEFFTEEYSPTANAVAEVELSSQAYSQFLLFDNLSNPEGTPDGVLLVSSDPEVYFSHSEINPCTGESNRKGSDLQAGLSVDS